MAWFQKTVTLAPRSRGFHLVTEELVRALPELERIRVGLAHFFIQHTSASLCINENADPTVRADLESHFNTLAPGAPVDPEQISDPSVPDYNYDTLSGVDYDIDISKPVGSRITRLQINGADVDPAARFVVAVNNYRRSGGGNFPGIVKTQVYNEQKEIRQLLIDWAQARGVIDPADFYVKNWQLVRNGTPIQF